MPCGAGVFTFVNMLNVIILAGVTFTKCRRALTFVNAERAVA